MTPESGQPWQWQLLRFSLKKRAKFAAIAEALRGPPPLANLDCLEVGCGTGASGLFLETLGGRWLHADPEPDRLAQAERALPGRTRPMTGSALPGLPDNSFDLIVAVDLLEHLADERPLLDELHRLLTSAGRLLITTPRLRPFSPPAVLRKLLGLRPEVFGHCRDGYTPDELADLLGAAGFTALDRRTFLGPVTSTIETMIDGLYYWLIGRWRGGGSRGAGSQISPANGEELRRHNLAFGLFRAAFPLLRALAAIDRLLPKGKGYGLLVLAARSG